MAKTLLAYHRFVATYLASVAGRDTPDSVAKALFALDPRLCGFDTQPNPVRLHHFRELIEEVHANAAVTPPDERTVDDTGVWTVADSLRSRVS